MRVDFVGRKVKITDQIREFTEKKLQKIEKYFNDILDAHVEIEQERHRYVVDLSIKGKDFDIQSTSDGKEATSAIQEAVDKLEMQARKAKTRLKDHKRYANDQRESQWPVDVIERESARTGQPRIVEQLSIPIKPMTIDEAALQLERSSDQFFVFRNANTDRVNVLYRRSDENLGLITPEP